LCHFDGAQTNATPSQAAQRAGRSELPVSNRIQAGATYHKVLDGRKRAIQGLWQRGSG